MVDSSQSIDAPNGNIPIKLFLNDRRLSLHPGDIVNLKADAIVCPVDRNLTLRSGLSRIIAQAAGKGFRSEKPQFPEPYGKIVVLPGGKLLAKYIFLSVVLGEKEQEQSRQCIRQAVDRAIRYAEFLRLKSIAFPLLGSLSKDIPFPRIAKDMLDEVRLHFMRRNTRLKMIIFSLFNAEAFEAFKNEVQSL